MKQLSRLIAGAVLTVSLTLTGCSATSLLSAASSVVSPSKPELTAQVGAENTKQGIGVSAKTTSDTKVSDVSGSAKVDTAKQGKNSTTVKDVQGPVDASVTAKAVTAGPVQADTVNVTQGDSGSLLGAFALGLAAVLILVFGMLWLFLKSRKEVQVDGKAAGTEDGAE